MKIKKLIIGMIASMFLANAACPPWWAIADSGINFKVDKSVLNVTSTVLSSPDFKTNIVAIGFLDEDLGISCGNGILEFGEDCDDGNVISNDGCSAVCTIERNIVTHTCGNRILEDTEQCEDGNTVSGDGCSSSCQLETNYPAVTPVGGGRGGVPIKPAQALQTEIPGNGITREIKIKARPEKRVDPGQNLSVPGRLVFYNTTLRKTILAVNIGMNDIGWGQLDTDKLPDGIYDISFKGISHLTKVIRNVKMDGPAKTLDFTDGGESYLIAGDVEQGKDDFINGMDISAAIDLLYTSNINADLNGDGIVNGLDVSIVVSNIYKHGEKLIM